MLVDNIDSLHIVCAVFSKCDYFLTTDDKILHRGAQIDYININDPIGFIKEVISCGFFRRLSQKKGGYLSPHCLRHTLATELMRKKNPNLKAMQYLLGH